MLVYAVLGAVMAIVVVPANVRTLESVRSSKHYAVFEASQEALGKLLVNWRRTNVLSAAETKELESIREAFSTSHPDIAQRAELWLRSADAAPSGSLMVQTLARFMAIRDHLVNLINKQLLVTGNMTSKLGVLLALVSILGAAYMTYHIQNVFYTRDLNLASRHPEYFVLALQLCFVAFLPFILLQLIEWTYVQDLRNLARVLNATDSLVLNRSEFPAMWRREYLLGDTVSGMLVSRRTDGWLLQEMPVFLMPLMALIAASVWLTRRFGWGVFLTCSVTCALVVTGMLTIGQSFGVEFKREIAVDLTVASIRLGDANLTAEISLALIGCIGVFVLLFGVGLLSGRPPWDKYVICSGYIGVLVLGILIWVLSFRTQGANEVIAVLILMLMGVSFVSLLDLLLRRCMFGFLHEPQP
jgi:hypothetical protein